MESDSRPDFFGYIMKNQEVPEKALTRDEMDSNAVLFLVAGSETTATALTGVTYLLLSDPYKYALSCTKYVANSRPHSISQLRNSTGWST
jgi:cytochrome P450